MSGPNLVFREWQKPECRLKISGWIPNEGTALVVAPDGGQKFLRFILPTSQNATRPIEAFGTAFPTEIRETRLLPPPCRSNENEAKSLRDQARLATPRKSEGSGLPSWELLRLRFDPEVLVLEPADREPLACSLEQFKTDKRKEYEARKRELKSITQLVANRFSIIAVAYYYNDWASLDFDSIAFLARQERQRLELNFEEGCLKWNLDEFSGYPRLRNPVLRQRWAKDRGVDLGEMAARRRDFLSTMPTCEPSTPMPGVLDNVLAGSPLEDLFSARRYNPADDMQEAPADFGLATNDWDKLSTCANIRFIASFSDGSRMWLEECLSSPPQSALERAEFVTAGEQIMTKLDAMHKTAETTRTGVQTLVEMSQDQQSTRDKWFENPLGSREAVAHYLVTMDGLGIKRDVAVSLVPFGYGSNRKECALDAKVSEATIKRALAKVRTSPYAKFFSRNRTQKLLARREMTKGEELFVRLRALAKKDPDELRAITEAIIQKAQNPGDDESPWEKTVRSLG